MKEDPPKPELKSSISELEEAMRGGPGWQERKHLGIAIAPIEDRERVQREFPNKKVHYFNADGWVNEDGSRQISPDEKDQHRRTLMWAFIWALGVALVLALCSCSSTGPVELSPGVYLISKSSAAGMFTDLAKFKAEVIREANTFAASKGKACLPIKTSDSFPTHGFPSVEYQFELVDKGDPRLRKP